MPRVDAEGKDESFFADTTLAQDDSGAAAPEAEQFCYLCKAKIEPTTNPGRVMTRALYEAYGLNPEEHNGQDVRLCQRQQCRLPLIKKHQHCPVGTCTTVKRKVKPTRPLPPNLKNLTDDERSQLLKRLKIEDDVSKCCVACHKRISRHVEAILNRQSGAEIESGVGCQKPPESAGEQADQQEQNIAAPVLQVPASVPVKPAPKVAGIESEDEEWASDEGSKLTPAPLPSTTTIQVVKVEPVLDKTAEAVSDTLVKKEIKTENVEMDTSETPDSVSQTNKAVSKVESFTDIVKQACSQDSLQSVGGVGNAVPRTDERHSSVTSNSAKSYLGEQATERAQLASARERNALIFVPTLVEQPASKEAVVPRLAAGSQQPFKPKFHACAVKKKDGGDLLPMRSSSFSRPSSAAGAAIAARSTKRSESPASVAGWPPAQHPLVSPSNTEWPVVASSAAQVQQVQKATVDQLHQQQRHQQQHYQQKAVAYNVRQPTPPTVTTFGGSLTAGTPIVRPMLGHFSPSIPTTTTAAAATSALVYSSPIFQQQQQQLVRQQAVATLASNTPAKIPAGQHAQQQQVVSLTRPIPQLSPLMSASTSAVAAEQAQQQAAAYSQMLAQQQYLQLHQMGYSEEHARLVYNQTMASLRQPSALPTAQQQQQSNAAAALLQQQLMDELRLLQMRALSPQQQRQQQQQQAVLQQQQQQAALLAAAAVRQQQQQQQQQQQLQRQLQQMAAAAEQKKAEALASQQAEQQRLSLAERQRRILAEQQRLREEQQLAYQAASQAEQAHRAHLMRHQLVLAQQADKQKTDHLATAQVVDHQMRALDEAHRRLLQETQQLTSAARRPSIVGQVQHYVPQQQQGGSPAAAFYQDAASLVQQQQQQQTVKCAPAPQSSSAGGRADFGHQQSSSAVGSVYSAGPVDLKSTGASLITKGAMKELLTSRSSGYGTLAQEVPGSPTTGADGNFNAVSLIDSIITKALPPTSAATGVLAYQQQQQKLDQMKSSSPNVLSTTTKYAAQPSAGAATRPAQAQHVEQLQRAAGRPFFDHIDGQIAVAFGEALQWPSSSWQFRPGTAPNRESTVGRQQQQQTPFSSQQCEPATDFEYDIEPISPVGCDFAAPVQPEASSESRDTGAAAEPTQKRQTNTGNPLTTLYSFFSLPPKPQTTTTSTAGEVSRRLATTTASNAAGIAAAGPTYEPLSDDES